MDVAIGLINMRPIIRSPGSILGGGPSRGCVAAGLFHQPLTVPSVKLFHQLASSISPRWSDRKGEGAAQTPWSVVPSTRASTISPR